VERAEIVKKEPVGDDKSSLSDRQVTHNATLAGKRHKLEPYLAVRSEL